MTPGVEAVPELVAAQPVKVGCILAHVAPLFDGDLSHVEISLLRVSRGIFHVRNHVGGPCLWAKACRGLLALGGHDCEGNVSWKRMSFGSLDGNGCRKSSST